MSIPFDSALTPERVAAALEAADIGVWEIDLLRRHFTCSARCKQLFGLPTNKPVALEDIRGAWHPEDRTMVEQHLAQALDPSGSGRLALEHRLLLANGEVRWVLSTGLAVFDQARSRPIHFQGITKDITETQARLLLTQHQGQELALLAESLPALLWIAGSDGAVTYFNPYWTHYTQQRTEQALHWGWEAQVHPEDVARCLTQWRTCIRTGEPYEMEYRFRRHDGEYRWFLGRALPWKDDQDQILQWFGTSVDIHKQKEIEDRLRQREDELERLSQELATQVALRTAALEAEVATLRQRIAAFQHHGTDPV
ncbi:PAS domain-containing protein [Hymenobacter sp. GOD-10R]|uniref:PAS domain-containing protein n=1 Tax=Hymenobacter sp. GOD-10R TaxID=3093922 RepID=UPI002D782E04|nr:PAS domain-containing protein [Hymenobacter sp. GOD-10R]WRQ31641.1 PAS domain-containing protein [Hymenobacter sp. GOD-10R]